MKRFAISLILVFALTSHAFGMGWLGGGHNDNGGNNGINNSGSTVTTFQSNGQQEQNGSNLQAVPVPEPLTLVLLGAGLVGIIGLRRKFKK